MIKSSNRLANGKKHQRETLNDIPYGIYTMILSSMRVACN